MGLFSKLFGRGSAGDGDSPEVEALVAQLDDYLLPRLARLDAESRLGGGKLTGGKHHGIDAIVAPREYPMKVWAALVAAGRLRSDGKGFFSRAVDDLDDV